MFFLINKVVGNLVWIIDLKLAKWNSYKLRRLEDRIRRKKTSARI